MFFQSSFKIVCRAYIGKVFGQTFYNVNIPHEQFSFRMAKPNEALAQFGGEGGTDYAEVSLIKILFFKTAFPEPVAKPNEALAQFGGEGGIRTLDWGRQYTISSRAPSTSSDTSPF